MMKDRGGWRRISACDFVHGSRCIVAGYSANWKAQGWPNGEGREIGWRIDVMVKGVPM